MTVTPSEDHQNLPAVLDADLDTGLEEFSITDAQVPRISIKHQDGLFRESLTGGDFPEFNAIIFGLVKQRILWYHEVDNDAVPMCKSPDFTTGFPLVDENVAVSRQFPWSLAQFDPNSYPPDEDGLRKLPCEKCRLKEWGSHPKNDQPYCTEQWTTPLMFEQDGFFIPAFVSWQKTALKPLQAYFTWFQARKGAPYQYVTRVSLTQASKGGNTYSIPRFARLDMTPQESWREYSTQLGVMREFLKRHPNARDSIESDNPPDNSWGTETVQQAPAGSVPNPVQPQTPPPAPPVQAPVQQPASVTHQPAEPVQQPAPAPEPVTVPAQPAPKRAQQDPNELPF